MAEDEEGAADEAKGGEDDEGEGASKGGGKKKLIIIIAAVLLLVIGGAAGAYFTGLLDPIIGSNDTEDAEPEEECEDPEAADCGGVAYYDLQELMINLNTAGAAKSSILKILVSFELENRRDRKKLDKIMPKIIDNFQTYLRELRIEDLRGSAGMYRLREELLVRVNAAAAPIKVRDVLFREMLVQ